MDFQSRRTVAPTIDAVTLAEARDYLEISGTDSDVKINRVLASAIGMFERHTRRALALQTWVFEVSAPCGPIELPRPPLAEIVSCMSRENATDDWAAVDEDDYVLDADRSPAQLTWSNGPPNHVRVEYRCGHADRSDIPSDYITSVLQLVVFLFENRGDVESKLPISLRAMLDDQRSGTAANYFSH
jgi:uncharacterized phiE125 gp8 family phage protein